MRARRFFSISGLRTCYRIENNVQSVKDKYFLSLQWLVLTFLLLDIPISMHLRSDTHISFVFRFILDSRTNADRYCCCRQFELNWTRSEVLLGIYQSKSVMWCGNYRKKRAGSHAYKVPTSHSIRKILAKRPVATVHHVPPTSFSALLPHCIPTGIEAAQWILFIWLPSSPYFPIHHFNRPPEMNNLSSPSRWQNGTCLWVSVSQKQDEIGSDRYRAPKRLPISYGIVSTYAYNERFVTSEPNGNSLFIIRR